ncbi:MAG: hypothetical protein HQL27_02205 [Candidatus Omnitrophica bacterium]|nr:hypothetical protein [Candidatus Omnitrophota bacterium]
MLKKLNQDKEGVVLVTVLMVIIVLMVLAVSVISLNVSQVSFSETEVQRIIKENLAIGGMSYLYAMRDIGNSDTLSLTHVINGITYFIDADTSEPYTIRIGPVDSQTQVTVQNLIVNVSY